MRCACGFDNPSDAKFCVSAGRPFLKLLQSLMQVLPPQHRCERNLYHGRRKHPSADGP
jgi:hypothetical protein